MFRFYSNENFPQIMVELLREKGYDILTSKEAGQANQAISDPLVLEFGIRSNRIIITLNRDDFIHLHRQKQQHCGIIICKMELEFKASLTYPDTSRLDNTIH